MNPITKTWTFCPNTVDAGRLYQACFVAYNPVSSSACLCTRHVMPGTDPAQVIGLTPEATTEVSRRSGFVCLERYVNTQRRAGCGQVNCVEIEVLVTNPLFDNPSPANG